MKDRERKGYDAQPLQDSCAMGIAKCLLWTQRQWIWALRNSIGRLRPRLQGLMLFLLLLFAAGYFLLLLGSKGPSGSDWKLPLPLQRQEHLSNDSLRLMEYIYRSQKHNK